jgi:uncharacterized repeat protein (TIGR03803 family)
VLYAFKGGSDGAYPGSRLLVDSAGNVYGTAYFPVTCLMTTQDCDVVFKLAPDGTKTVLHYFVRGSSDGFGPSGGLIADSAGNLYGTTYDGGGAATGCGGSGCGVVFKLSPDGTYTVLHTFTGSDGANPATGLIADSSGNLYGTTVFGGGTACAQGCGVVFKVAPDGTETVLYSFKGGTDGLYPAGRLIADSSGNLYGVAEGGALGGGVVFKLAPDGTETVLYSFCSKPSCSDGEGPSGSLIADSAGNLYGTTATGGGGGGGCYPAAGCGVIFKLAPDGTETVLYYFRGGSDGANPQGGLIADSAGNLYGTARPMPVTRAAQISDTAQAPHRSGAAQCLSSRPSLPARPSASSARGS